MEIKNNKLNDLNIARTNLLKEFLRVLGHQINSCKKQNINMTKDLKIVKLHLGRRTGATTWIKEMLKEFDYSSVICLKLTKEHEYKNQDRAIFVDDAL